MPDDGDIDLLDSAFVSSKPSTVCVATSVCKMKHFNFIDFDLIIFLFLIIKPLGFWGFGVLGFWTRA